ncbi:MAG: patatin-like phospholipase family protein [Thermoflexales bacterium]|nr:patatin-like phospholipase family protein [Thermoflexales bacterium]
MTRALVLSSGLGTAAYQIGALRHLLQERHLHFDVCAGSGLGAINAAFIACGEFNALQSFWQHIGWRKLLAVNWHSPLREGTFTTAPLKRFLAAHVNESKLAKAGTQLKFTCLNLQTGREELVTFPGSPLPLIEILGAAFGPPGLAAPLRVHHQQWTDASYVNSFILRSIVRGGEVDDVWAIATSATESVTAQAPRQRYAHWRAVAARGLQLNQAHDVWQGLSEARQISAAAAAHQHVRAQLPDRVAGQISDPVLHERVRQRLTRVFDQSAFPIKSRAPNVHALTPSRLIAASTWRFRHDEIQAAQQLGYHDAQALA